MEKKRIIASPSAGENTNALLEAANQASAQVSVLHIAFMVVCSYVLVVVCSTTDFDLLVGKGVKLPGVDLEVPIRGFYAIAPVLVVLIHFNFFLQLYFLSQKLYAVNIHARGTPYSSPQSKIILVDSFCPAPVDFSISSSPDRLHTFLFTYYLVRNNDKPLIYWCLGTVVAITMLLLPIVTLISLQLRFLAYQDASITWIQRCSTWIDIAMIGALWPIIMDRGDKWANYISAIGVALKRRKLETLVWIIWWFSMIRALFTVRWDLYGSWVILVMLGILIPILTIFLNYIARFVGRLFMRRVSCDAALLKPSRAAAPGMLAFLLVFGLGLPLPLALVAKGEKYVFIVDNHFGKLGFLDRRTEKEIEKGSLEFDESALSKDLSAFRTLNLRGEVLLAKSTTSEIAAKLRQESSGNVKRKLELIEPLRLHGRSLRGADLSFSVLVGVDLTDAHLERADLTGAQLDGANFVGADLSWVSADSSILEDARFYFEQSQGEAAPTSKHVSMRFARFVGANMKGTDLRGADLSGSRLDGADLAGALLGGAKLHYASLVGANLTGAQLQGAQLQSSRLQGADFRGADLTAADLVGSYVNGAEFADANLNGVDFRFASLYGASFARTNTSLVDIRDAKWSPTNVGYDLVELQLAAVTKVNREIVFARLARAESPGAPSPRIVSCLADDATLLLFQCQKRWRPAEIGQFQTELYSSFEQLACRSSPVAGALLFSNPPKDSARSKFMMHMDVFRNRTLCIGVRSWEAELRCEIRKYKDEKQKNKNDLEC